MLGLLLVLLDATNNRFQQCLLLKCDLVKFMLVASHRFLKTARTTRFVYFDKVPLLIDF